MKNLKKGMEKEGHFKVILGVAVFIAAAILISSVSLNDLTGKVIVNEEKDLGNFTKCLTKNNVKLYGPSNSPAMKTQERISGDAYMNLYYVDCLEHRDKCAGILTYPTWKVDKRLINGALSLDMLSQLTGCEI